LDALLRNAAAAGTRSTHSSRSTPRLVSILAAVIVFVVCQACHARAMEFLIETRDTGVKIVKAIGPIRHGDAEKLRAVAGQATIGPRGLRAMLLSGPGGFVEEAKLIAHLISAFDFQTMVDDDCASACASILYPAGKAFILLDNGRLGFHPCYSSVDLKEMPECTEDIAQFSLLMGFLTGRSRPSLQSHRRQEYSGFRTCSPAVTEWNDFRAKSLQPPIPRSALPSMSR
jgi:hypothetical protein